MPERPTPDDLAFRGEVARLRADERRRRFPLGLNVGHPDGHRCGHQLPWPVPTEYDAGLRFDVLDALVEQLLPTWQDGSIWCWLTRPGVPEVHDVDLDWLAAARRATGAHGVPLVGFRAVTRTGWHDTMTGRSRWWKRLRG